LCAAQRKPRSKKVETSGQNHRKIHRSGGPPIAGLKLDQHWSDFRPRWSDFRSTLTPPLVRRGVESIPQIFDVFIALPFLMHDGSLSISRKMAKQTSFYFDGCHFIVESYTSKKFQTKIISDKQIRIPTNKLGFSTSK
jgi:hypothetical protein